MADITITNVDDAAVQKMLEHAARTGRTLDAVARDVLLKALHSAPSERVAAADRVRAMTPATLLTDATEMVREDRDRR